jgi:NADH dehydrogenase (ubiquinone) Fe-S protein 5
MADAPQDCIAQRDDYLECLHHTKEVRTFPMHIGEESRVKHKQSVKSQGVKSSKHEPWRLGEYTTGTTFLL